MPWLPPWHLGKGPAARPVASPQLCLLQGIEPLQSHETFRRFNTSGEPTRSPAPHRLRSFLPRDPGPRREGHVMEMMSSRPRGRTRSPSWTSHRPTVRRLDARRLTPSISYASLLQCSLFPETRRSACFNAALQPIAISCQVMLGELVERGAI